MMIRIFCSRLKGSSRRQMADRFVPLHIPVFNPCHGSTMNPILHPIFALLASVTRQELARQVAYLKEENKILRARLPQRLVATPQERRRLLKFGRKLGVQLRDLISIVSYQTFVRWIREKEAAHTAKQTSRKPGRPRTPEEIRELVLKLARENEWGYNATYVMTLVNQEFSGGHVVVNIVARITQTLCEFVSLIVVIDDQKHCCLLFSLFHRRVFRKETPGGIHAD